MIWRYDPYFAEAEMRCPCGECDLRMKPEFMDRLVEMRVEAGFPFIINSAARCPKYNAGHSDSGLNGPHTTGMAADIGIFANLAFKVVRLAFKYGMTGIGVSQKGNFSKRFIHVDCLPIEPKYLRPRIWSY